MISPTSNCKYIEGVKNLMSAWHSHLIIMMCWNHYISLKHKSKIQASRLGSASNNGNKSVLTSTAVCKKRTRTEREQRYTPKKPLAGAGEGLKGREAQEEVLADAHGAVAAGCLTEFFSGWCNSPKTLGTSCCPPGIILHSSEKQAFHVYMGLKER